MSKIGFGGSCHWCTEAIFQALKGVSLVEQGWISAQESPILSEAVIVHFNPTEITLDVLIEIHLRTHSSTSDHSMRDKYRSAVYSFDNKQYSNSHAILTDLQGQFTKPLITKVLHFQSFQLNTDNYLNYYQKNPDKPFCKNMIDPKLQKLRQMYGEFVI